MATDIAYQRAQPLDNGRDPRSGIHRASALSDQKSALGRLRRCSPTISMVRRRLIGIILSKQRKEECLR